LACCSNKFILILLIVVFRNRKFTKFFHAEAQSKGAKLQRGVVAALRDIFELAGYKPPLNSSTKDEGIATQE
jgi:hypothetical protein